jgi:hypothetical protein
MRRVFLALALLAATAGLRATVTVPLEFRQVVRESTVIAVGHVTDVRGISTDHGGIDSIVTVAVDSMIKGPSDRYLSIRLPGGQIGSLQSTMVGVPKFSVGQYAVFFVKPGPDHTLRPVGLTAGIYRIQVDARTGAATVDPPLVSGITAPAGKVVRGAAERHVMPLKEFMGVTQLVMAAQAESAKGGRK